MAYKSIVAFFAVFVVALVAAIEEPALATGSSTSSLQSTLELSLEVTANFGTPDVQAAIDEIRNNAQAIKEQLLAAAGKIQADKTEALEKLDNFLQNLKTEIQLAGVKLSEELKARISEAVDTIRALIEIKKQLIAAAIAEAQNQLDQAAELLKSKAALVTQFIQDSLNKFSKAVNSSRFILQTVKDKVNQAITKLNDSIRGLEMQNAILNVVQKLNGRAVEFSDIIKALAAQLLASGNVALAGVVNGFAAVQTTVSAVLGGFQSLGSLNLDIQVEAAATAGAA